MSERPLQSAAHQESPQETNVDSAMEPAAEESAATDARMSSIMGRINLLAKERSQRAIQETIIAFQSDAVEIEQGPPPRLTRSTLYILLLLFAVAITWASLAHVDKIITAQGKLITTSPLIVVQPLETAVIKEITVRPGDVVKQGQVLAVLDSTFSGADLNQLESQRNSYRAQIERMNAQYDGKPYVPENPADPHAMLQTAIYKERQASYEARLADLDEQVAQATATLATLQDNARTLSNRLHVAQQIEDMRLELQKRDVGSKLQSLAAHDQRLQISGELEAARNRRTEVQHQLRSLQSQRVAFEASAQQDIAKEIIDVTRQYDSVVDALRKARRREELSALKAPQDAVVLTVAQRTVGSVLQAAEPVVTLVPLDSPLEAEVRIAPEDVGQLSLAMPTKIKLDAFPFQKHGALEGELSLISENTFTMDNRPDGQPYYRGTVKLTKTDLNNIPDGGKLLPGMTLSAEIKKGDHSVMGYLLSPLMKTFDESLREP